MGVTGALGQNGQKILVRLGEPSASMCVSFLCDPQNLNSASEPKWDYFRSGVSYIDETHVSVSVSTRRTQTYKCPPTRTLLAGFSQFQFPLQHGVRVYVSMTRGQSGDVWAEVPYKYGEHIKLFVSMSSTTYLGTTV